MASVKRTVFAQQGFDFAGLFTIQFARLKVAGVVPRTPHLLAPESDSTGGGKQALQHITLKPDMHGYPPITVGSVNVAGKGAQLRTYQCLYRMQEQRGRQLDLEANSYQQFFDQAKNFLGSQGFTVQIEMEPPAPSGGSIPPPRRQQSAAGKWFMYLFIASMSFVLLVLLGFAAFVAIKGWPF